MGVCPSELAVPFISALEQLTVFNAFCFCDTSAVARRNMMDERGRAMNWDYISRLTGCPVLAQRDERKQLPHLFF